MTSEGMILVRVAVPILHHLAADGSGPVLLIGAEKHYDGTYELTFKRDDRIRELEAEIEQLKAWHNQ